MSRSWGRISPAARPDWGGASTGSEGGAEREPNSVLHAIDGVGRRIRSDWGLICVDAVIIVVAWSLGLILRYDGVVPLDRWSSLWGFLPTVLGVTIGANALAGSYSGIWQHAGLFEARRLVVAQAAALAVLVPLVYGLDRPVPLSVPLIAATVGIGMLGAIRFRSRLWGQRPSPNADRDRLVVLGAGSAGASLARDVAQHSTAQVVAFLDDDPRLWGRKVQGVPVVGPLHSLRDVAVRLRADYTVLAIPSAPAQLVRAVAGVAEAADVVLRIVPPPSQMLRPEVRLTDVRDIEVSDLLGRGQVQTDLVDVTAMIRGKTVLITGAGGSIGSEIARQVWEIGAARVVLVDHDETHLFDTAATVPGAIQRLVDIRDADILVRVMQEERPEVVFHAAAHKHVPLLEDHPVEAARTNVLGTRVVVEAARRAGVRRFVFISTDKAVRPNSVMGATKCAGEQVVLSEAVGMTACAVRFGNVLGSRGSVVPTFVEQIRAGGPVTVTDARMTRYFMSIPEAVRLVLHAAALSTGRDIFMLDMGEPVRIIELAQRMIRLSGRRPGLDVEIRITGIRPGEKLAEILHSDDEEQQRTSHPSILRLRPRQVDVSLLERQLEQLEQLVTERRDAATREALFAMTVCAPGRPTIPSQPSARTDLVTRTVAWT